MLWSDLKLACKAYLLLVYALGFVAAFICFAAPSSTLVWIVLAVASFLIAGINLPLPDEPSVVISMSSVFTIAVLFHFGTQPALVTYWANVTASAVSTYAKVKGRPFLKRVKYHRLFFNLACCSLSVLGMSKTYEFINKLQLNAALHLISAVVAVGFVWFLINTGTLSIAVALTTHRSVLSVCKDGLSLSLISFFASSAAAGLISLYFENATLPLLILSIPIAVLLYHLYLFYTQRVQQTQLHISKLNEVFLQTIE